MDGGGTDFETSCELPHGGEPNPVFQIGAIEFREYQGDEQREDRFWS